MNKILVGILLLLASVVNAQHAAFEETWNRIDSLELTGQVSLADSLTQELSQQAFQQEKYLDFIKGKLYHYKFYQINKENSNNYILRDLNATLQKTPFPYNNILNSYKAEILEDYFQQNRYKIRNRSKVNNPDKEDLETWSSQTLQDSIVAAYEKSLGNPESLAAIPTKEISLLLNQNSFNRAFQPSVFDLLIGRAIDFYSDASIFTSEFGKENFNWENEKLFAEISEFLQLNIPDTTVSSLRNLKLYQKAEAVNAKKEAMVPLVYWTVQRMKFVQSKSESADKSILFLEQLEVMTKKFKNNTIQAYVKYEMAHQYYLMAENSESNEKKKGDPGYFRKAIEILDEVIEEYPRTSSSQKARRLRTSITNPLLTSKIPEYLAVNEPGRIWLSYRNVDTLYSKIIKVSKQFAEGLWSKKSDSIAKNKARQFKDSSLIQLPGKQDYRQHSTEVLLKGQKAGTYLVYLYDNEGNNNYGFYQVSDISVSETAFDKNSIFHARHRQSGKPIKNIEVISFNENKNKITWGKTDANGELKIRNRSSYNDRNSFFFIKDLDSLNTNYSRNYYQDYGDSPAPNAKTMFFLDRAIYRPGQKVFFKGILLKHENDSTHTVPNEFIPVFIEDPNGKIIEEFRFKTNEYGSFTGSFVIPKTGITGQFGIYSEEDTDSDSPFWNKIWNEGEYSVTYTRFSVEEYKRPSFKISFDTIKESFSLNENVQINGNVSSFMGAPISSAKLKYEIVREELINSWWYKRYSNEVQIAIDSLTTNEDGDFQISFLARAEKNKIEDPNLIYRYTISASATDISGETREGTMEIKLGNKNLLTELDVKKNIVPGDTLHIALKTINLNGSLVPVTGALKVFKLQAPGGILKERLWEAPEFNNITKEEFNKLFPNEPYKKQLKPEDWPKEKLVYESLFKSNGNFEDLIPISNNFKEGKYLVEVEVESDNNQAKAKKIFQITNPDSKYLADNQPLLVSILNDDPSQDDYVDLKVQTVYKDLVLTLMAFDENTILFKDIITVNGKKTVKIPLNGVQNHQVQILLTGVRDNTVLEVQKTVSLETEAKTLNITTNTFRNKVQPGLEETWSFSVQNEDSTVPDAEILASMYDASLDQFKVSEWNTEARFSNRWLNFPRHYNATVGVVSMLDDNFPSLWKYRSKNMVFDKLSFFGFQFGRPNSWQYRNYLERMRKRKENKNPKIGAIKGIVTDEDGLALPGVMVSIKSDKKGTQTNFDGEFAIDAKVGDVLVFSYLGFASIEHTIVAKEDIYISLEADAEHLDEVVTVGYGEQEIEEEEQIPFAALQGKVAGLEVSEGTNAAIIKIRGSSSITSESALYVVDGKVVDSFNLNQEDILSLETLNGAEATALYGTRAANGVIVITTKSGLKELQEVEARDNLDETAFFFPDLKLGEDGKVEFSFTTPEALTSWKLRLLAHKKDWTTGQLKKNVITQKDLNVIPNPPRFLREGDTLVLKAKISNLSSEALSGNAILQLFNAITMQPIDLAMGNEQNLRSFQIKDSQSEVVSWQLKIPDTIPAVIYRIVAKAADFSDGEENILPVLKNRMLVKESMPFFVRSGETESYTFESLENNDSKTLRNHQFSIEYSSNPAWYAIQSLPYLMEFEHECSEQIFSRIFANSVGNMIVTSRPKIARVFEDWKKDSSLVSKLQQNEALKSILLAETPWVMEAEDETLQKKRIAELFDTQKIREQTKINLQKLRMMQNYSGAFPWFAGGPDNFYITQHIVSGFARLIKLNTEIVAKDIIKNAIDYLDKEVLKLEKNAQNSSNTDGFCKSSAALHYLDARKNFLKEYPFSPEVESLVAKIIKNQKEDWLQKTLYEKAVLAVVLNSFREKEIAVKILNSLKESAVKSQDYGMYWKENIPSWYYNRTSVEVQAKLMEAFSTVLEDEASITEMKIWLIQNKRTTHWPTTKATTAACYALLMNNTDWSPEANRTLIKIGAGKIEPEKIISVKKEAGTGYFKMNWEAEEIKEDFGEITIENKNSNPGYGGAYWQYFEDLDKIKDHAESPLNIEKELYLTKPGNKLQRITPHTPIKLGDLVTVRLVVRSSAAMDFIHLKDMRASSFEPTDVLSKYKYQDGAAYYQSTRDAATHFFFDILPKGTFVLEYTMRANNSGQFSNGITTLESMYAPEFSGHTRGIRVDVEED